MIAAGTLRRRCAVVGATAAAACIALTGCGSSSGSGTGNDADATTVAITLTNDGCAPTPASVASGLVTFDVTNKNADAADEVELLKDGKVIGEKENLTPGLSGNFSLQLTPGTYVVSCPDAKTDHAGFTVTAAAGS